MRLQLAFESSDGRHFSDAHRKSIPKPRTAHVERIVPSLTLRVRYIMASLVASEEERSRRRLYSVLLEASFNLRMSVRYFGAWLLRDL